MSARSLLIFKLPPASFDQKKFLMKRRQASNAFVAPKLTFTFNKTQLTREYQCLEEADKTRFRPGRLAAQIRWTIRKNPASEFAPVLSVIKLYTASVM